MFVLMERSVDMKNTLLVDISDVVVKHLQEGRSALEIIGALEVSKLIVFDSKQQTTAEERNATP